MIRPVMVNDNSLVVNVHDIPITNPNIVTISQIFYDKQKLMKEFVLNLNSSALFQQGDKQG